MTREEIIQELEFRARVARTIARSIRLNDCPDPVEGRGPANAASLEHTAKKIQEVANIIREEGIDR